MKKALLILICLSGTATHSQEDYVHKPDTVGEAQFRKNFFVYDFLSPAYSRITVAYERLFVKGKLGIRPSYSHGYDSETLSPHIRWSTGLELKLYPTGQGKARYYFGVEAQYGVVASYEGFVENQGYNIPVLGDDPRPYQAIYAKNGVIFHPYEHLGFNVAMGIGALQVDKLNPKEHGIFEFGVMFKL